MAKYKLLIHGGAGTLLPHLITEKEQQQYRSALKASLLAGEKLLVSGRSSEEAVIEAVRVMEESALFNAGKGAVFTHQGTHELDASFMCGKTLKAAAVCSVQHVRNPILLCREILKSEFVMLQGKEAENFAREQGMELVSNDWFSTSFRRQQLNDIKDSGKVQLDHSNKEDKYGTVGAVAIDREGNVAAATSTGGMTNKRYGRVGDSALIGCGTYASNRSCAISCTGWGEYFIRSTAAVRVAHAMEYGQMTLEEAARKVIFQDIAELGGDGGLIGIDAQGEITMPFNTDGMYRGLIEEGSDPKTAIFKEDLSH